MRRDVLFARVPSCGARLILAVADPVRFVSMRDNNFAHGEKSAPELRKRIVEDLKTASEEDYAKEAIKSNRTLQDWSKLNDA
jgi:hypothetical protein